MRREARRGSLQLVVVVVDMQQSQSSLGLHKAHSTWKTNFAALLLERWTASKAVALATPRLQLKSYALIYVD